MQNIARSSIVNYQDGKKNLSIDTVNSEPEEPTEDDLPIEAASPEAETQDEEPAPKPKSVRPKSKTSASKSKSSTAKSRVPTRSAKRPAAEPRPRVPTNVSSVWQYAYHRLQVLRSSSAVRKEVLLTTLFLCLTFAAPMVSWMRRWLLADSLQSFGAVVLPLTLLWLWLNRYRLMLPELDTLMKRYQAGRMDRLTSVEKWMREEREYNAVISLLKEKPLPPKRLLWPLLLASVFTFLMTWINDPTFTALAFVFLVIGLVGYRHGTQALRVMVFPLLFLFLMVPLPGVWLENVHIWLTGRIMSLVLHIMLNLGMRAELKLDYNPLTVLGSQPYDMWASQVRMGVAPALIFLVCLIWYLSLIRARFRTKLFVIGCGVVWLGMLVAARLTLLAWIGIVDKDMVTYAAPATLYLLPLLGALGELFVLRGFKCQKYQKWVSI